MDKPKTINDFIRELQQISPNKRNLPLVIACPNGMTIYPKIKMLWDNQLDMLSKSPDKMIITWDGI